MRSAVIALLCLGLSLTSAMPGRTAEQTGKDPDGDAGRVQKAIEAGIRFFRAQERGQGHLEATIESRIVPGGLTALGTLALVTAGVPADDPMMKRLLGSVRDFHSEQTYVVALQTMVFTAAGQNEDKNRIQDNVEWLIKARHMRGTQLVGWSYTAGGAGADNSNTQYALLGLHAGHEAGAKIPAEVWESIREFYTRKDRNGNYVNCGYHTNEAATSTMTSAALCGALIAGMDLSTSKETIDADGKVHKCGVYEEDRDVAALLEMVNRLMPRSKLGISGMGHTYYWLYGLERVGRLSGQRFIGETDWYRLGCDYLVEHQQKVDGSWFGEGHAYIATSFALLFLSKGRTPVLISKLVHDPETDWNNDRNDVRHLTNFASTQLFHRQPLAWQVFDARRAGDLTPQRIEQLTSELLQSPIAYFNGHHPPRFTQGEEELLRHYIANGGFILAEACCDEGAFDTGFRDLMNKLFPDTRLRKLEPGHPIWTASGKFRSDSDKQELWGIDLGCKTVVVYSPKDLSCRWEANHLDDGRVQDAFALGANIIAYATGLEIPRPRLTEVPVFREEDIERKVPRGYLKVGQVRHEGDWRPAQRAMPNLMLEMRKLGLDVSLQAEEVRLGDRDFPTFKFLYVHGRRGFAFSKEEIKRLRFNLETGGLLLGDACCGYRKSREFDRSFRDLMKELWPDKPLEVIPLNDDLYGKELNGTALTSVHCRREAGEGQVTAEYRAVTPQLEGIRINGRWAVIYSKYDLGCALENHQSADCLGHDHASAVQIGKAVVLYALRR